jgi:hypothetical protein
VAIKHGEPENVTIKLAVWLRDPLDPLNTSVNVPVEADDVALTANVEVAGVPGPGVMGLVMVIVTPTGADPNHE